MTRSGGEGGETSEPQAPNSMQGDPAHTQPGPLRTQGHHIPFPGSSAGKESACSVGDPDSIPGLGGSLGEGVGYTPAFFGFPGGSDGKESTCNVETWV